MKWILGFIIISLFSVESCRQYDEPLHFKIINASNKSIYFVFSYSYPDTSISKIGNPPYYNGNKTAKINSMDSVYMRTIALEISEITQMFIFDADTVENNPWDSIIVHNYVLKRYQFSKSDLENWNWTIKYP